MSLDMLGHIDETFVSVGAIRTPTVAAYIDGKPQVTSGTPSPHAVTLQPLNDKEIQFIPSGGERDVDTRKIYINDGDLFSILPTDKWNLDGIPGAFKSVKLDNRPWRNYCKVILSLEDLG